MTCGIVFSNNIGAVGYGSCKGDSGSPLVFRQKEGNHQHHVHVGIVSYGNAECNKDSPFANVFVRTSAFIDWIKEIVCERWEEEADFCP